MVRQHKSDKFQSQKCCENKKQKSKVGGFDRRWMSRCMYIDIAWLLKHEVTAMMSLKKEGEEEEQEGAEEHPEHEDKS